VILAGGRGTRMAGGNGAGTDKSAVLLSGRPMIAHVLERLAPQVEALAINANGDAGRFAVLGLPVIADRQAGFLGPLAGMLAGLEWGQGLQPRPSHIVFVPTDTPFVPEDLVARLMAAAGAGIAMAESSSGSQQAVVAIPVGLAEDLDAHVRAGGRLSILGWLERHGCVRVRFDDEGGFDPFMNVNTPEELAEAERLYNERR
jgi:molybdopterin-guanine dinucleotide biosynthesis protein A